MLPFDTSLPADVQAKVDAIGVMVEVRQQLAHACVAASGRQRACCPNPRAVPSYACAVQEALLTSKSPSSIYALVFNMLGFRPIPAAACSCPGRTQPDFSPDPAAFQKMLAAMK
jgi:hypothetical protein